jgi:hypothetical protein
VSQRSKVTAFILRLTEDSRKAEGERWIGKSRGP